MIDISVGKKRPAREESESESEEDEDDDGEPPQQQIKPKVGVLSCFDTSLSKNMSEINYRKKLQNLMCRVCSAQHALLVFGALSMHYFYCIIKVIRKFFKA